MAVVEKYFKLMMELDKKTAAAFGYQWKKFEHTFKKNEEEFLSYVSPFFAKDIFKDKIVLDAGCGGGKFCSLIAKYGAKMAVGIDFSDSCYVAYQAVKHLPNAYILKADINNPPFKEVAFDIIFSIGVLHHLPDPRQGFMNLAAKLKKRGVIFVWVYAKEGNALFRRFIEPIRKHLTSKLPFKITEFFAKGIAFFLWAMIKLIYLPAYRVKGLKAFFRRLPYNEYFIYFYNLGFDLFFATIFDKMAPPIVYYFSENEFKSWFESANLEKIKVCQRNRNSWGGYAQAKGE